ncbi:MAG: hypothetical protein ACQEP2_06210 [Actinomycetota bacterium]
MDLYDERLLYDRGPGEMINVLFNFPKQFNQAENSISDTDFNLRKNYRNALVIGIGNLVFMAPRLVNADYI